MAEEKKNNEIEIDKSKIHASKMKKGRKTINYLQKCKDEGKKIVQVCPANRDQYFAMAADMAEPLLKREVCPAFDYHAVRALRRQIMEDYIDENGVEPKPGLLPMIRDLQRMRMRVALATATPEVRARKYLRMVGVEDAFDAVACAEMVAHGKPAPDVYLLAAQKLNLPPEELLGVEDSPSGVRSAHSAGMTVAMIPDQDEPSAEIAALCALVAPTLEGIMPFIEKLNANKFG